MFVRFKISVHPRIRGERSRISSTCQLIIGSSPHTRGTPVSAGGCRIRMRFIPAYAGNASGVTCTRRYGSVHPRIRGERIGLAYLSAALIGSSPHTRGTPTMSNKETLQARFIPAYAGNASSGRITRSVISVHPRIRGERRSASGQSRMRGGSSPHTRGTRKFRRYL